LKKPTGFGPHRKQSIVDRRRKITLMVLRTAGTEGIEPRQLISLVARKMRGAYLQRNGADLDALRADLKWLSWWLSPDEAIDYDRSANVWTLAKPIAGPTSPTGTAPRAG
jgi:hypothetical protein